MGLKSIPSVVQLPGGVMLKGLPFKVIDKHPDGSPKTFELLMDNSKVRGDFVLYASEAELRRPMK